MSRANREALMEEGAPDTSVFGPVVGAHFSVGDIDRQACRAVREGLPD